TVKPAAHAVEHSGNVFAHVRPVRTAAVKSHLARQGEEAMLAVGHDSHHLVGQFALEQFEHRADVPGTFAFDGPPGGGFELCDADSDLVQFRTADDGFDTPGPDVQVADGTIADIGPPTWQAVGIVGEGFQMIAPAFAPEAAGDGAPVKGHRLDVFTFFA